MPSRRRFAERLGVSGYGSPSSVVTVGGGGSSEDADLAALILALSNATSVVGTDYVPVVTTAGVGQKALASVFRTYVLGISGGVAILPEALTIGGNFLSDTTATDDIGATGTRWKDGWFSGTVTAATLAGTLSTATQNSVTTMTALTTIGTLVAGAVPASLVTAGTFGAGAYAIAAGSTTNALVVTTTGAIQQSLRYDASTRLDISVAQTTGVVEYAASISGNINTRHRFTHPMEISVAGTTVRSVGLDIIHAKTGGDATNHYGSVMQASWQSSGTVTNLVGLRTNANRTAGTVTNAISQEILALTATCTTAYGLFVGAITGGSTNYAIYTDGTAQSRFGGLVTVASGGIAVTGASTIAGTLGSVTTLNATSLIATNTSGTLLGVYYSGSTGLSVAVDSAGLVTMTGGGSNRAIQFSMTNGVGFGVTPSSTTQAVFAAGTTGISSLRVLAGAAPTAPVDGDLWNDGATLRFREAAADQYASWTEQGAISDPSGGGVQDAEARAAIAAIIDALQATNIIA